MSMERHRCKLCSKVFSNGRALGGHMRSHLATLLPPPKKKTDPLQLGHRTHSDSSSTPSEEEIDESAVKEEKLPGYGLRNNPKRSLKATDPDQFLDAGSVVQDRESETESTHNPTCRGSKRGVHREQPAHEMESKKSKCSESVTESAPVSSVSDAGQDEEVALCLMMLSRDDRVWVRRDMREEKSVEDTDDSAELKKSQGGRKMWKANRAGGGQRESRKEKDNNGEEQNIYECPFCSKVFGSGQALGGHKRSHLLGSSRNKNSRLSTGDSNKPSFILDLNLPAPIDDDRDDQDRIPKCDTQYYCH